MKDSEALRKGAFMTEPLLGSVFRRRYDGVVEACALGAIAIGRLGLEADDDTLCMEAYVVCKRIRLATGEGIWKLNDCFKMTREEIADWLEERGL